MWPYITLIALVLIVPAIHGDRETRKAARKVLRIFLETLRTLRR